MKKAIVNGNEIRCPVCGKLVAIITGDEIIKNFVYQCPRKLHGVAHSMIIDVSEVAQ